MHIDLDADAHLAIVGITRAYVFMALAHNAVHNQEVMDVHLPGIMKLGVMPRFPSKDQLETAKSEFEHWIVANGIRELLEKFGHYLVLIYRNALLLATKDTEGVESNNEKRLKMFSRKGVSAQLKELSTEFDIDAAEASHFHGLTAARNCLTHRLGIVGPEDCTKEGALVLTWRAAELVVTTPAGVEEAIPADAESPYHVPAHHALGFRWTSRRREFHVGEKFSILPYDLQEICFTALLAVDALKRQLANFARDHGANVIVAGDKTSDSE